MKPRVIVTGATGMVGEGVLHECLNHPDIEAVVALGRRPYGASHPKLSEIVVPDMFDLSPAADRLTGFDACFFCLGTTSIGKSPQDYERLTYDLTMNAARLLAERNPGMVFCYVSGAGTDSSERGRMAWARVKGRTENHLMKLPFRAVYAFRPGYLHPTPGLRNALSFYRYITFLYPLMRFAVPGKVSTLAELGRAMIAAALKGYHKRILEVRDIVELAHRG